MSRKPKSGYYVKGQFIAYGSELDTELNQREVPSKTDLKRQSQEMQDLGQALLTLRAGLLNGLNLPEKLLDALQEAKRISNFEGKRRQMQFIGKLMRGMDPAPIRAALHEQNAGSDLATQNLHAIEKTREALLASDDALGTLLQQHPEADVQHLRTLIRQARKDQAQTANAEKTGETARHSKAYRELFQALKALMSAEQDEIGEANDSEDGESENA